STTRPRARELDRTEPCPARSRSTSRRPRAENRLPRAARSSTSAAGARAHALCPGCATRGAPSVRPPHLDDVLELGELRDEPGRMSVSREDDLELEPAQSAFLADDQRIESRSRGLDCIDDLPRSCTSGKVDDQTSILRPEPQEAVVGDHPQG